MKEKKEKNRRCRRRFMAMLAAVCILNAIPYTGLTVNASENIGMEAEGISEQEENLDAGQMDTGETENTDTVTEDVGKKEDTGQKEDAKEQDAEDSGQKKEPEELETEDSGQTGEKETEEKEESENLEEPDKKEDLESGEADETETEEVDTEGADLPDAMGFGEMEKTEEAEATAENSKESLMLLAKEAAGNGEETVTDGTYTDENGIVYHYHAYEDGTANLYELDSYRGKDVNIPENIDGHIVTQLTFQIWGVLPSVTIPETVTYIGEIAFANADIGTLYYNAAGDVQVEQMPNAPFRHTKIGSFVTGENVHIIPAYIFSFAEFQGDITVTAEAVGEEAFAFAAFPSLILTKEIKEIRGRAFVGADMQTLYYDTEAEHIMESSTDGMFRGASIQELVIDESITKLPDYVFSYADFCFDEYTVNVERIGAHAFDRAWGSADKGCERLTLSERVNYIGAAAFANDHITTLDLQASAESGASGEYDGGFYCSYITDLSIGEDVTVIPDYLFSNAHVTLDGLVLNVESIGRYAFYSPTIHMGNLTIGEAVSHIGDWAFGSSTYDKAIIYTTKSDSEVKSDISDYLPVCKEVEIHGNSPYYEYFTGRSEKENITLLCEDFETTYGEESYDEEKDSFVTTVTESCVVCGYEKTSEERKNACTVIFIDHDGRELSRQHVAVGSAADAPEVPERTGYEFTGWDKSFTNVTSDITITAQYEIKSFSVSFQDKETIISKQKITYGGDAVLPKEPKRPEEEWGSWKFTGWKGNYRNVMQDEVLQAQFEKVFHEYEVLFYDAEGNILSRQSVTHGEDAEVPDAPEKKATAQYSYTFIGWDGDTENVTGNREFHPRYDAVTRFFTVTFVNGEEIVSTQSVAYGGVADVPEEIPEITGYDFTGWDKDYSNIVSDLTVSAQYKIKTFYVSFKDKETIISKQKIVYGSDAALPENPVRPEEEWGTWKFTGWDGNYKNIMQDEVLQAQFGKVFHEYEVVFYDAEGNILSRQSVTHGEDAEIPDAPEKKATAQYNYTFTGWDGDTKNITGNISFYPVYDAKVRSYTVTFLNGDTVLDTQTVLYGKAATAPEDPERAEEVWGTWKFVGWIGDYTNITKDRTIRAQFEKVFKEYKVIFYDEDGNVLSRQTVAYGQAAKAPEAPEKEPTKQHCYPFTGWNGDITNITADAEFYPTYGMETRTYTVTFMNGNAVFAAQKVEYGASAKTPAEPKKEADAKYSYHFTGWDGDYSVITGDTVIHALYDKKEIPPKTEPGKEVDTGKTKEESGGSAGGGNGGEPALDAGGGNTNPETKENSGENPAPVTEENSGESPDPETEGANAENQDIVLDILTEEQPCGIELPEEVIAGELLPDMDSETETLIEIPKEEQFSEDMDSVEVVQEEVMEDAAGDDRGMSAFGWFILLIGILLFVFLFLWLLFQSFARRKVCGTMRDESGGVPCGIQLTLSGKDIVEAELGENGSFHFDGLKKEDYRLNVYDADSNKIFSADIRMKGGSGEAVFFILESGCSKIETNRKRGKYEVNLTV